MTPYENLANAIVLQAVRDYRRNDNRDNRISIERFFRSDWFKVLTKVDGDWLIQTLRKEQAHGC